MKARAPFWKELKKKANLTPKLSLIPIQTLWLLMTEMVLVCIFPLFLFLSLSLSHSLSLFLSNSITTKLHILNYFSHSSFLSPLSLSPSPRYAPYHRRLLNRIRFLIYRPHFLWLYFVFGCLCGEL